MMKWVYVEMPRHNAPFDAWDKVLNASTKEEAYNEGRKLFESLVRRQKDFDCWVGLYEFDEDEGWFGEPIEVIDLN